jgi:hypothetical protein
VDKPRDEEALVSSTSDLADIIVRLEAYQVSIDQNILNCGLATVVVKPFFVYVVLMVRTHEKPA